MDIETVLQESDPARQVKVPAADSPLGMFIRRQVVTPPTRRSMLRVGVIGVGAIGAGVLLIIGTLAVILTTATSSPRNHKDSPPRAIAAPSWKLVNEVNQSSWEEPPTSGYQSGLALTCPTTSTCYVEDSPPAGGRPEQVEFTHDGGATWQQATLPGALNLPTDGANCADTGSCLTGLDCVNANTCVTFAESPGSTAWPPPAGDYLFVRTDDGGQSWNALPVPGPLPREFVFSDVSCTTPTSCVAVGAAPGPSTFTSLSMVTTDGGRSWSQSELPVGFVAIGVRCFVSASCLATGWTGPESAQGAALYSPDGGSTWLPATMPTGIGRLGSVSCGDPSDCLVTATSTRTPVGVASSPNVLLATTDGGKTWMTVAAGGLPLPLVLGVSCATASYCWVSGAVMPSVSLQALLAVTQNEGQSWQTVPVSPSLDIGAVPAVSCPDMTTCFALGYRPAVSGQGDFVILSHRS
jgi:hypothetical protein